MLHLFWSIKDTVQGLFRISVLKLTVNRRAAHSIAVIVQRCSNPNRLLMSYLEKRKKRNKPINQNVKQREKKHPWESVLPRFQWQRAREGWQLLSVLPVGLTSATCTLFSIPCKQCLKSKASFSLWLFLHMLKGP